MPDEVPDAPASHLLPVQAGPAAAYTLNPPLAGGT
jgi:hypothetical protein